MQRESIGTRDGREWLGSSLRCVNEERLAGRGEFGLVQRTRLRFGAARFVRFVESDGVRTRSDVAAPMSSHPP